MITYQIYTTKPLDEKSNCLYLAGPDGEVIASRYFGKISEGLELLANETRVKQLMGFVDTIEIISRDSIEANRPRRSYTCKYGMGLGNLEKFLRFLRFIPPPPYLIILFLCSVTFLLPQLFYSLKIF